MKYLSRYCGTKPQVTQGSGKREYPGDRHSCGEEDLTLQQRLELSSLALIAKPFSNTHSGRLPRNTAGTRSRQLGEVLIGRAGQFDRKRVEGGNEGSKAWGHWISGGLTEVSCVVGSKSGCFFCPHALLVDQEIAKA
ncbi:MAG: hypothetical protein FJ308_13500 [Planctomycetes bacterium]|nr:hypothetical protein [Planctomycetota bacterium]